MSQTESVIQSIDANSNLMVYSIEHANETMCWWSFCSFVKNVDLNSHSYEGLF